MTYYKLSTGEKIVWYGLILIAIGFLFYGIVRQEVRTREYIYKHCIVLDKSNGMCEMQERGSSARLRCYYRINKGVMQFMNCETEYKNK